MYSEFDIDHKLKIKKLDEILTLPTVIRVTKFNEDGVSKFITDFGHAVNSDQGIIPIVVDSYGGEVHSLFAMVDILKSTKIPIATIGLGKHMSCGAVLMTCGTEGYRYMAPNATLMIHDASWGSFGKVEEMKTDAKELERLNQRIYKLMAANVGKPEKYFLDIVHHEKGHADWYINPEEALSHNLVNHIGLPKFTVSVKVDISFGL